MRVQTAAFQLAGIFVGVLVGAAAVQADETELYTAAKKERELVWYTSQVQNTLVRPMAAAFQAKYPGIKVTIVGGKNADLILKILSEAKAGVHIVDVSSPARLDKLDQADLLARYKPQSAEPFPDRLKSKDGKWTAMLGSVFGVAINTELVKPADEPKTLEDYLDPKWKGKMAWVAHYDIGGGPGLSLGILYKLGQEKGMDYLRKLAKQEIIQVPANQRVVLDQLISGEFPVALGMFQHHVATSLKKGAPIKWLGNGPLLQTSATIAILKHAPHPSAARLFVEFVLSEEGQKIVSKAGYPPVRPNVEADKAVMTVVPAELNPYVIDPGEDEAILEKGITVYRDVFK